MATSPVTPTPVPDVFATKLMESDIATTNFEGQRGGAFHKVIRWAFEKQGLYPPAGATRPITVVGAPPRVDVYIDNGNGGEYPFLGNWWNTTDIWNRRAASVGGGGGVHQTPVVGVINYAYVRVKNRGTQTANIVVVRAYHCKPGTGLVWPGDWKPMTTPSIALAAGIPPGGSVVVGPFRWKPEVVGHECLLMSVSAKGDLSNLDPATGFPCAAGPTPEWRVVPFDNNIGQRNVAPVAGGGGRAALLASFAERRFYFRNPCDRSVRASLRVTLPPLLAKRDWKLTFPGLGELLSLPPGAEREVVLAFAPGEEFDPADVKAERNPVIEVEALIEGMVVGGMTYVLDPNLQRPAQEVRKPRAIASSETAEAAE